MIERHGVQCDTCPKYESLGDITFFQKVEAIKRLGWELYKIKNTWFHRCPDCVSKRNEAQRRHFAEAQTNPPQWWNKD